jgi:hypothetical protein
MAHPERLDDLVTDGEHRIQRRLRILKDHRDPAPADAAHLRLALGDEIFALEEHLALDDAGGRLRQETQHREPGHRLAAARLTYESEGLALAKREAHPVHRAHDAPARVEIGAEVLHLEDNRSRGTQRARDS